MKAERVLSSTTARRLAVMRQCLAGPRPSADSGGIMDVMRDLRYLQVDPMRVVAPSHVLVLWSRLGRYDLSDIDKLLWEERLIINAVYAEPNTPRSKGTGQAVADAIEELGVFLSAKGVCYTPHVPLEWKSILHQTCMMAGVFAPSFPRQTRI